MRVDLAGLRRKYRGLLALRRQRVDEPPREAMRALARRFPGCLRELDELPLDVLEARALALEDAPSLAAAPLWARAMARYHELLRGALAVKRAGGRARSVGAAARWVAAHADELPVFPTDPGALRELLEAILRPPDGRLNRLVMERVGEPLGLPGSAIEDVLFPPSPQRRTGEPA